MFLKNLLGMSATETVGGKLLGGVIGGVGGVLATEAARYIAKTMFAPDIEVPAEDLSDTLTREERDKLRQELYKEV